jgi:hypothetical protein
MSELVYDVSCCLSFSHAAWLCKLKNAGIFVGGMGVSIWSLIIAAVVLYMVTYLRPVRIANMYPLYFLLAVLVPMVLAFYDFDNEFELHCGGGVNESSWSIGLTYTYGRVVCLVLSIIVYALTSYKSHLMRQVAPAPASQSIETLCGRMKYYVLVQVFIRLVPTYTQVIQPHSPFALQLISSMCAPLSGLGYFVVFMTIHPGAARLLLGYFRCVKLIELRRAGGEAEGALAETVRGSLVEGHEVTVNCSLIPVCILEWACCYCHEMGVIAERASEDKAMYVGRYSWVSSRSRRPRSGSDGSSDATVALLGDAAVQSGSNILRTAKLDEIEEGDEEEGGATSFESRCAGVLAMNSPEGSRIDSISGEGILLSRSQGNSPLDVMDAIDSYESLSDSDDRNEDEESHGGASVHSVISDVSAMEGYAVVHNPCDVV